VVEYLYLCLGYFDFIIARMQKEPDEIHDFVRFTYRSGVIYGFLVVHFMIFSGSKNGYSGAIG